MSRSSTKSRQNVKGIYNPTTIAPSQQNDEASTTAMSTASRKGFKREPASATETVTEQVFHRKSERRRVARDIFLVFEEQPNTRRSRGSHRKQPKPKFGHLKVEDPMKPKGLLRDIKNEPKCYLSRNTFNSGRQLEDFETTNKKISNNGSKSHFNVYSSPSSSSHNPVHTIAFNDYSRGEPQLESKSSAEELHVARVNPIFLWAKQDNTRIIEVRCEDYDKRNRIRITKTLNGWRAIPRSDPSSSKVLKLYNSPLIKVKNENHSHEQCHISPNPVGHVSAENKSIVCTTGIVNQDNYSDRNNISIQLNGIDTINKPTSKKSKKKKSKKRKRLFTCKKVSKNLNVTNVEDAEVPNCTQPDNIFTFDTSGKQVALDSFDVAKDYNRFSKNNSAIANSTTYSFTKDVSPNCSYTANCAEDILLQTHYTTAVDDSCSLQLCPKTGLFLRNTHISIEEDDVIEIVVCNIEQGVLLDKPKNTTFDSKLNTVDDNSESLEAKTKNLKDLLDDADLFQNCDDNAKGDTDLIDTIVKSSCENNLIHDNEASFKDSMNNIQNKNINAVGNHLAQLITDVSDPPKCLSFNEAGEIEALNCELFQPNTFIDTFEKQPSTTVSDVQHPTQTAALESIPLEPPATREKPTSMNKAMTSDIYVNIIEDSPKDLSYKKREEVCPPSESRSQCAVTSSSDIVKSPNIDETSVLTSSSETLKNLILEQFMKLSTISNQQKDSIELERDIDISNLNSIYSNCMVPPNVIETVVIDDDDITADDNQKNVREEPLKKRLRSNAQPKQTTSDDDFIVKAKMAMIDKDPDPLTQLRLLIRNSQWKVPDPILVPKDRLSAVLASPAREIPLLITTRPELRLPEAFAYPEIIQNPNILVISMAQLEAILKNDLEISRSNSNEPIVKPISSPSFKQSAAYLNNLHVKNHYQSKEIPELGTEDRSTTAMSLNILSTSNEKSAKCPHIDSSLSSDINAATMAVLNQMLWLPYFGQISHDFIKSLKNPHNLSQKVASLLPFSGHKVNGAQRLDEICDTSKRYQTSANIPNENPTLEGLHTNATLSSMLKQNKSDELTLFQKIVHHQMQSVLNFSQTKNENTERSTSKFVSKHSSSDQTLNLSNVAMAINTNLNLSQNNKNVEDDNNVMDATEKSYNLRSSIASRQISDINQYSNMKRVNFDNKPRLTCKSLSNLLEPEHNQQQSTSTITAISCVPITDGNCQKGTNGINDKIVDKRGSRVGGSVKESFLVKHVKSSINSNVINTGTNFNKQKTRVVETTISENGLKNGESSTLSTEINVPLWHPLFGSNSKTAYSSPWQWTTVTAAGE